MYSLPSYRSSDILSAEPLVSMHPRFPDPGLDTFQLGEEQQSTLEMVKRSRNHVLRLSRPTSKDRHVDAI